MNQHDVYLYGMILITNSYLLAGKYPEPDTYGEITQKYVLPGGETGTSATVLASLGCQVKMDGTHMGKNTYPKIAKFYEDKTVDITSLYLDDSFDGLEDYVIIDQTTRTPFGMFQQYFSDEKKRWNAPLEEDIISCKVAGIDPFFQAQSEKTAELCQKHHKPFVMIDAPYDSILHQYSSIHVISTEFIHNQYPEADRNQLFEEYTQRTNGLVLFTHGAKDIMYGRKGEPVRHFQPYRVPVVSTLGAGDTFKAGCVYALLHQMNDEETVKFASAAAASACSSFPIPLDPPTLEKIERIYS
ncbi:PfkB family carbohydrate kinase [Anaeromicropila populeti]|uniref:Sugar or nucleoside kinase, ribokinase family n=1 Tax=Anaeromicropila populeti TaxID=37658 RepID=A0A1I6KZX0_9FIRM|nr:PfkB family carbohydrate kinase [Anaeromicropila populeti]SFR96769.1 Sugar or nucleoside kinase, ribokinase family [Anaeromicropila populeti]